MPDTDSDPSPKPFDDSTDVPLLAFQQLTIRATADPNGSLLVHDVSGFVAKGGMTAVVGASGSGKSILMEALCGRLHPSLRVTGKVIVRGRTIEPGQNGGTRIGFVGQEDSLVGELTVRETFRISAQLRLDLPAKDIEHHVDAIIAGLGLSHVADNVVGTFLKRGLSGGEKRRCSVGKELVAMPEILCLDEPTSGLDASSAYVVLRSIRSLARSSGGRLCVLASIHQPNARLLDLFDHLMVLGGGSLAYFGPVKSTHPYLQSLGFTIPQEITITDYLMQMIDQRARTLHQSEPVRVKQLLPSTPVVIHLLPTPAQADFVQAFREHDVGRNLLQTLESLSPATDAPTPTAVSKHATSWLHQFLILSHRFLMQATRDPTLYLLQFVLNLGFGFMVGVEFWRLPREIGHRLQDVTNGLVWLVFIATYLQVFKIYYLMVNHRLYRDEHANGSYRTSAWSAADLVVTSFASFITFIPGLVVGYVMMDMPIAGIGYTILVLFTVALASESLMELLVLFVRYIPTGILIGQGALVVLCVFAGGAFIDWSELGFWYWLSQCSLYTWSTRGLMIHVFRHLAYSCPAEFIGGTSLTQTCVFNGRTYPLDSEDATGVRGATMLAVSKDFHETNEWFQYGMLLLMTGALRILAYIFLRVPVQHIPTWVRNVYPLSSHEALEVGPSAEINSRTHVEMQQKSAPGPDHVIVHVDPAAGAVPAVSVGDQPRRGFASLHWSHLTLRLKSSQAILVDNVDGEAKPGRLLAIMGPSGAGKTTLLNALSFRAPYADIAGCVQLGNSPLTKSHLNFVQQFDCLSPASTVTDSLRTMSRLKTMRGPEEEQRQMSEITDILGLEAHAHKQIGALSSGDRKRVSIGLALISNPSVLFLDEPTTGLDSVASYRLVEYLVRVTRSTDVVCVLTIHQPSAEIFAMIDDLLLLSRGRTAYFGAAAGASAYFSRIGFPVPRQTNPADFFLDLMNAKVRGEVYLTDVQEEVIQKKQVGVQSQTPQIKANGDEAEVAGASPSPTLVEIPESWRDLFDASASRYFAPSQQFSDTALALPSKPSELRRLTILVRSRMQYFWLERSIYLLRLVELLILAVFIGTLFLRLDHSIIRLNDLAGAMFFSIWVILFAAISATPIFVRDRVTNEDEYLNGAYSLTTHVGAQFLAALPYQLVSAVVFQTILWFLVGFHDAAEAWIYSVLMTLSLLLLMEGVSLLLVHFLRDAMLATTGSMVCLGMLFLFNGFFVRVADSVASIAWLSWCMPTKYALDGMVHNILDGQQYDDGTGGQIDGSTLATDFFSQNGRNKWLDWLIVTGFMIAARAAHWAALRWHYRSATL